MDIKQDYLDNLDNICKKEGEFYSLFSLPRKIYELLSDKYVDTITSIYNQSTSSKIDIENKFRYVMYSKKDNDIILNMINMINYSSILPNMFPEKQITEKENLINDKKISNVLSLIIPEKDFDSILSSGILEQKEIGYNFLSNYNHIKNYPALKSDRFLPSIFVGLTPEDFSIFSNLMNFIEKKLPDDKNHEINSNFMNNLKKVVKSESENDISDVAIHLLKEDNGVIGKNTQDFFKTIIKKYSSNLDEIMKVSIDNILKISDDHSIVNYSCNDARDSIVIDDDTTTIKTENFVAIISKETGQMEYQNYYGDKFNSDYELTFKDLNHFDTMVYTLKSIEENMESDFSNTFKM